MIKYSILLIEDSKTDQELITYYLNKNISFEAKISIADTLNEAVSMIHKDSFDVILTDLNLPDSESENTLKTILELYHNKPIVVLTSTNFELEKTAMELGAQDFFDKNHINEYTLVKAIQFAITRHKHIQNLINLSLIDSTTRTYNYKFLHDTFENLKQNVSIDNYLSLFLIDIRNFNTLNTTYGREFGDSLLYQIASRLNSIPMNFYKIVSRGTGTQFYMLLIRNRSDFIIDHLYKKIYDSLSKDWTVNKATLQIEFKIGQSDLMNTRSSVNDLISECETAIKHIVDKNDVYYNHYTNKANMKFERKKIINQNLNQSIDKDELYVVYQPVVNIATNKINFCESLVRWDCSNLSSSIFPDEFIPIAEENGFIKNIGKFILNEFIKNYNFFKQNNIKVSINLSVKELTDKLFADNIIEKFEKANASSDQLIFEITEYTQFINSKIVHHNIYKLIEYGFLFSIDDFGTGYSTFHQIGRYSGSIIKIDKSFIDNIDTDTYNQAIVSAIANMGNALGIKVVAEGVEDNIQLKFLKSLGIDYIQGYYFYKPVKINDFRKLLDSLSNSVDGA